MLATLWSEHPRLLKSGLPEESSQAAQHAMAALGFLLHPASQSQNARRVSLSQAGGLVLRPGSVGPVIQLDTSLE